MNAEHIGRDKSPLKFVLYALLLSFLSAIIVTAGGILYTGYVDSQSNKRWCSLITLIDDTNIKTPPTTEIGKQYAIEIRKIRNEFGC